MRPSVECILAVAVTLAAAHAQSVAPSFSCAKASSSVEKFICKNNQVAALDLKLAAVYEDALKKSPDQKAKQREWLKQRDACSIYDSIEKCLIASYERRITEVQIDSGLLSAPKIVNFQCDGSDRYKLTIAYYNDVDPQAAVVTYSNDPVLTLALPSASGARYGWHNVEFWEHQGEAQFTWKGKPHTCKPQ
jgi:uncharacterized protein